MNITMPLVRSQVSFTPLRHLIQVPRLWRPLEQALVSYRHRILLPSRQQERGLPRQHREIQVGVEHVADYRDMQARLLSILLSPTRPPHLPQIHTTSLHLFFLPFHLITNITHDDNRPTRKMYPITKIMVHL